jgi:hypothetical protein
LSSGFSEIFTDTGNVAIFHYLHKIALIFF